MLLATRRFRSVHAVQACTASAAALRLRSTLPSVVEDRSGQHNGLVSTPQPCRTSRSSAVTRPCLSFGVSAVTRRSKAGNAVAALGQKTMTEGVHRLTFAARGDCIVGFAKAFIVGFASGDEPDALHEALHEAAWRARAWGVGNHTGCYHHAASCTSEGMPGVEVAPQRALDDEAERTLHFELDLDESRLRLRCDAEAVWRDVPARLPAAVRPWALLLDQDAEDAVPPSVRLVSCEEVVTG